MDQYGRLTPVTNTVTANISTPNSFITFHSDASCVVTGPGSVTINAGSSVSTVIYYKGISVGLEMIKAVHSTTAGALLDANHFITVNSI